VPAATGWWRIIGGSSHASAGSPGATPATNFDPNVISGGRVTSVESATEFTAETWLGSIAVRIPQGIEILWPPNHVPTVKDTVNMVGAWTGQAKSSIFEPKRVWFNIERFKGTTLSPATEAGAELEVPVIDASGRRRELVLGDPSVFESGSLIHSGSPDDGVPSTAVQGLAPLRGLPTGAAVDVIGYQDNAGRFVVSWIEAFVQGS